MGRPARILIVDDDKNIAETMAVIIDEEGYEVDCAESGLQAIKKSNLKNTMSHYWILDFPTFLEPIY